jgi:hypothetical protein
MQLTKIFRPFKLKLIHNTYDIVVNFQVQRYILYCSLSGNMYGVKN